VASPYHDWGRETLAAAQEARIAAMNFIVMVVEVSFLFGVGIY